MADKQDASGEPEVNSGADELDAETKAYFESGGEKLPAAEPEKQPDAAPEKAPDGDAAAKAPDAAAEPEKQPAGSLGKALQEEREEKRALREEHRKASEELAVLRDRWQTLLSMQQQEQPKDELGPEPDRNTDIFAHNAWLAKRANLLEAAVNDLKKQGEQTAAEKQAAEVEQNLWASWHQDAADYKAKVPEFDDVVKWMSGERAKQLRSLAGLHPQLRTEAGIAAQINGELKGLITAALQAGIRPTEYVHNMGKEWGYKGKAAEPDPAKVIEQAAKGADAEVSLSNLGGGAAPGPKTPDDVMAMTEKEFAAWFKKNPDSFRRMAGG